MNQKTILLALFSSIFLCFSSFSLADEPQINAENYSSPHHLTETPKKASYGQKIGQKLLWGLSNSTLGFFEIPKNIIKVTNDTNLIYGLTGGIGLGILQTSGRTLVGILDLTFFLLPTKPIVQPIHPWQNYLTVETAYGDLFDPDF
ncbi:exosortase system-associated protein, TIGR04073 family [methanotrophic endosymbiont of Bathymodiolus puteoserpentis (Logatchev)]|jgi:putative exosortase-associated protein (TIGR04073 family)|uniref:exosortase system-associated protein, TIGR04073 family n=1 Tax=methanotrophic endosymbiont of Bathymodiolus puteoserpentis (Logatchev) TaxID=343235 RepID=UPI0013CABFA1|nr:exosortase system-associated protein, TIGR04073 family [methanotrophic endosymbiont of Bathymodiolus puteoserpentis (Logatchev)]SHE22852.1 hypothetical protein BPUTEOMOX_3071 [methanotrophic endosymbiont of Bathymodiolus puteoserpentis (Logatchev)]